MLMITGQWFALLQYLGRSCKFFKNWEVNLMKEKFDFVHCIVALLLNRSVDIISWYELVINKSVLAFISAEKKWKMDP